LHKRLNSLILLLFSLAATHVNAQYLSVKGDFSVDQQRGCNDLTVTVTKLDPTPGPVIYLFEGWDPSNTTTNNFFTYTTPGDYWLYQVIQAGGGDKVDSLFIQILSPDLPVVELQTCNAQVLQVQIYDTHYDIYEIDYGDGSPVIQQPAGVKPATHTYSGAGPYTVTVTGVFLTANTSCGVYSDIFTPVPVVQPAFINNIRALDDNSMSIDFTLAPHSISRLEISVNNNTGYQVLKNIDQGLSVDTIKNLSLVNTVYCFRIATVDACSNFVTFSNEVCSIRNTINAVNNGIDLDWLTYVLDVNQTHNVTRNGSPVVSLASSVTSYSDTTTICQLNYCYQLEVIYPGGASSTSTEGCETAVSTDAPIAPTDISSINSDNQVNWNWLTDTANLSKTYIYDVSSSGPPTLIDSTQTNSYQTTKTDNTIQCIYLVNKDICDNLSPQSLVGCSIEIQGTTNSNGSVTLTWNNYLGWQAGVLGYAVVIMDQNGMVTDSVLVGNTTGYIDLIENAIDQISSYVVYALASDPTIPTSRSQIIRLERLPLISIPNSFTPNGDGLNDLFQVSGKFIESIEMTIFNRWGSAVYYTTKAEGWNGNLKNSKAPLFNYTYKVVVKDFIGNEHIRSGTVLILNH
jgi:gliding motility-associated-like protein